MDQKTVFISYRRALSKHLARSIYQDLKINGWDVFLDVNTMDSGDFDRIILNQIGARAHFILLISPGSLERCANSGDWVLREIQEAVRLERNIVPIIDEGVDFDREMGYLPSDLRGIVSKKNALPLSHFYFDAAVERLRTGFLKSPEYIRITDTPPADRAEVRRRMAAAEAMPSSATIASKPRSIDLLPAPFAWIEIPAGRGTMKTSDPGVTLAIPTERYWIAKYPVTNAQYKLFIDAGGYDTERWWTAEGWKWRQKEKWTEPRHWHDAAWNDVEMPVMDVSWFEAVAFCRWLREVTGEKIMMPTEAQWQYAAQGDDGRAYPWGDEWNCTRCNNQVSPCGKQVTTEVTRYEGIGDSPFGVVDMAGNVWEWCLTDYDNQSDDGNVGDCVLRGGSWISHNPDTFRCDFRIAYYPAGRGHDNGFRLALS